MIQDSGKFSRFDPYEIENLYKHIYFFYFFNRNSGFTFGKAGKVVLAIRSTHGLEVPLTDDQGKTKIHNSNVKCIKIVFIYYFRQSVGG